MIKLARLGTGLSVAGGAVRGAIGGSDVVKASRRSDGRAACEVAAKSVCSEKGAGGICGWGTVAITAASGGSGSSIE